MPDWTVEYIYLDTDGSARVSIDRFQADSRDEAMAKAAAHAPAEEFLITLHGGSVDQDLGTVRHRALEMSGRGVTEFQDTNEDDPSVDG